MPIATYSDCSYLLLELVSVSFIHAQLGIAQPYTYSQEEPVHSSFHWQTSFISGHLHIVYGIRSALNKTSSC